MLTLESESIKKSQNESVDYEIDDYVVQVEDIIKKKLHIYKMLYQKLNNFKKALREEEEISSKVKKTFYF